MDMADKRQFNILNFFYGVGAAVILVAAAFKFLGWKYADIIFVAGILVEAVVFLVSAFDWKKSKEKNYDWAKVFPQLASETDDDFDNQFDMSPGVAEGTQQQQVHKIMQTIVALNNSVNELNNATKKLTTSVSSMESNYEAITESSKNYQKQLDGLSDKISNANKSLAAFEKFNYSSESSQGIQGS
jgi:FtsZ-binding cell division protein ZapB